jgi:hypothetical protein|eukprot:g6403.t1
MEESKMKFAVNGGHYLVGILTKPTTNKLNTNQKKVIILVHGGMANKNSFYHKHLAKCLSIELGYCTFRYDLLAHGESVPIFKERGSKEQYRNMMSGFLKNLDDLKTACEYLQGTHGLQIAYVFGHSAGGQLAHMLAVRHGERFRFEGVAGINMRFDLEYWRKTYTSKNGDWVLNFKNRGKAVCHTVKRHDVDAYADVPMKEVSGIECEVLNVYGILGEQTNQANYDTGAKMLTDGVVPFTDVESTANLIPHHTLKFMDNVGHYYREDGSHEKLWVVIRDWMKKLSGKRGRARL